MNQFPNGLPTSDNTGYPYATATVGLPAIPDSSFARRVVATVTERGNSYGHPQANHQLTADLLSAWLTRALRTRGQIAADAEIFLSAEDVCMFNALQKSSRMAFGTQDDGWLDIMGYGENVSMLRPDQRNTPPDADYIA